MAAAGSSVSVTFTGQGVYGNFDGTKDGPSTDNDGDALAQGMLYFNTTDSEMRVYDGANWLAASSAANVTILEYTYTVAGSPTSAFTGSDDDGASLAFFAGICSSLFKRSAAYLLVDQMITQLMARTQSPLPAMLLLVMSCVLCLQNIYDR